MGYKVSIAKQGHLIWWQKELGALYLQDIRSSIITEKKQKLLTEQNSKGKVRTGSTCKGSEYKARILFSRGSGRAPKAPGIYLVN